jgi:hypothetical protein
MVKKKRNKIPLDSIKIYNGRKYLWKGKERRLIHMSRIIMEEKIGRKLNSKEIVHHINKNKSDDRIENLELISWEEHSKLHNLERNPNWKKEFKNYQREYNKKYYKRKRADICEQKKEYYRKNKDRIIKNSINTKKAYRDKNREEINKKAREKYSENITKERERSKLKYLRYKNAKKKEE